jgi:hypothetical protein
VIDLKGDSADTAIGTLTPKLLEQIRPDLPSEQLAALVLHSSQFWILEQREIKFDSLHLDAADGNPSLIPSG